MKLLEGAVRSYAWGSRTALAELAGRATPSDHPEAELWFGSHPGDPARIAGAATSGDEADLLQVIRADPRGVLGPEVVDAFGTRLPFLIKLLAAAEPLSLQAHPSLAQAREGYAAEEAAGIPRDSPQRNYRDDNHKPELVVALTEFDALAGFRDPHRTVALLEALAVPALEPSIALLREEPDAQGLRTLFTTWITLPSLGLTELAPAVVEAAVGLAESTDDPEFALAAQTTVDLAREYPGDVGPLAALLLNRVRLQPGQGLYLPAGNLHAYLHGVGVEIMASSDNVLRGGLTPKYVDVPELLRVLDFTPCPQPVVVPEPDALPGVQRYRTPTREFALSVIRLAAGQTVLLEEPGPRVVLVTAGAVAVSCGDQALRVPAGAAAFADATDGPLQLEADEGPVQVFLAATPAAAGGQDVR